MKVIHIESGLGNQMLSYCEYLAIKKMNPNDDVYIETIIYDIPECNESIRQWNGYELGKIFGISVPNVKELFDEPHWKMVMDEIRKSRFWVLKEHNWNYPVAFTTAFARAGLELVNARGDFETPDMMRLHQSDTNSLKNKIKHSSLFYYLQAIKKRKPMPNEMLDCRKELFIKTEKSIFTGQKLLFKFKGSGIEQIEDEIRQSFTFPNIEDTKNMEAFRLITECNSVAIHARRGDMLGSNGIYYATGFFKRAVKFIKKNVPNPVFWVFCDPDSVRWALDNASILGLDRARDVIKFVDWNTSENSYRDMQLMASCKHQIITNSSFGWWAAWLNTNPDKITISPEYKINTTHTL